MVELRLVAGLKTGGVRESRCKHQAEDRRLTYKDVGNERLIPQSDTIWNRWELGHVIHKKCEIGSLPRPHLYASNMTFIM